MLRRTGVPVGLIPCAHGGTSMDQWSPALKGENGNSLYGSMVRRVLAAGGKVKGVLWYQGEADANPKAAGEFLAKFQAFVGAVRTDFGILDLPFYYVQLGRHVNGENAASWNLLQESQRKAEELIPHTAMIASVDVSLDDAIHIGTQDQKRLARRLANLVSHDLFSSMKDYAQLKRGPRPVSAKMENGVVRVTFSQVNGRLQSEGRLNGFSVHSANGDVAPVLYKEMLDPNDANAVLLYVGGALPEKAALWYGYGKDPYCNLRDAADMALPVFGPMAIQ